MMNFELLEGVDFQKGCYPGQEVVARSQYRGTIKRRMFLFDTTADASAGQDVFHSVDPEQPCGMVVNAAPKPCRGQQLAGGDEVVRADRRDGAPAARGGRTAATRDAALFRPGRAGFEVALKPLQSARLHDCQPRVSELFIYYRVNARHAIEARSKVLEWQRELGTAHPALHCRLLMRPEEREGLQTWMETYAIADPAQSLDAGRAARTHRAGSPNIAVAGRRRASCGGVRAMCLVALAIDESHRFPLVIATNRDEFFSRPAARLGWWSAGAGAPDILGGRDLESGGTWLGLTAAGRLALVTNVRQPDRVEPTLRAAAKSCRCGCAATWAPTGSGPASRCPGYNGFNLIAADFRNGECFWASNQRSTSNAARARRVRAVERDHRHAVAEGRRVESKAACSRCGEPNRPPRLHRRCSTPSPIAGRRPTIACRRPAFRSN